MLVPRYWAECRLSETVDSKTVTVRRYGWSNTSTPDAQRMADDRAREALAQLRTTPKLRRFEPKVPYNGAEGVPIREEILEEHGETIITRNSYGAHCLNTPRVLFADVDYEGLGRNSWVTCGLPAAAFVVGPLLGWLTRSPLIGAIAYMTLLLVIPILYGILHKLSVKSAGGPQGYMLKCLSRWVENHPDWRLRAYATPAGLRVIALHATFDPNDQIVAQFFKAIGADNVYVAMCTRQKCFRARLTAKPWRAGVDEHIARRIWPVPESMLPARDAWVAQYEAAASQYAACRYLTDIGDGPIDSQASAVCDLHDHRSGALSNRPLA